MFVSQALIKKWIQCEFDAKLGFKPSLKDIDLTQYNGTSYCRFKVKNISYLFDGWNIFQTGADYTKTTTKKKIGIDIPEGD